MARTLVPDMFTGRSSSTPKPSTTKRVTKPIAKKPTTSGQQESASQLFERLAAPIFVPPSRPDLASNAVASKPAAKRTIAKKSPYIRRPQAAVKRAAPPKPASKKPVRSAKVEDPVTKARRIRAEFDKREAAELKAKRTTRPVSKPIAKKPPPASPTAVKKAPPPKSVPRTAARTRPAVSDPTAQAAAIRAAYEARVAAEQKERGLPPRGETELEYRKRISKDATYVRRETAALKAARLTPVPSQRPKLSTLATQGPAAMSKVASEAKKAEASKADPAEAGLPLGPLLTAVSVGVLIQARLAEIAAEQEAARAAAASSGPSPLLVLGLVAAAALGATVLSNKDEPLSSALDAPMPASAEPELSATTPAEETEGTLETAPTNGVEWLGVVTPTPDPTATGEGASEAPPAREGQEQDAATP